MFIIILLIHSLFIFLASSLFFVLSLCFVVLFTVLISYQGDRDPELFYVLRLLISIHLCVDIICAECSLPSAHRETPYFSGLYKFTTFVPVLFILVPRKMALRGISDYNILFSRIIFPWCLTLILGED